MFILAGSTEYNFVSNTGVYFCSRVGKGTLTFVFLLEKTLEILIFIISAPHALIFHFAKEKCSHFGVSNTSSQKKGWDLS